MSASATGAEALVAALEQWPESGVPDHPGAWLTATAKHRGIDRLRRAKALERKTEELGRELELRQRLEQPDLDAAKARPPERGARRVPGGGGAHRQRARAPGAAGAGGGVRQAA